MRWLLSARACGQQTFNQQNSPVLNCRCRLTQVGLYNGRRTVVVVVILSTYTLQPAYYFHKECSICLEEKVSKIFQVSSTIALSHFLLSVNSTIKMALQLCHKIVITE